MSPTNPIAEPDDIFFLTRDEVLSALGDGGPVSCLDVAARRSTREQQARLVPPLLVGRLNPLLKKLFDAMPRVLGAVPSDTAIVSGTPASPGRAPAGRSG